MDTDPESIEDGVTQDGLSVKAIDAATDYLAFCGNMYGWWPNLVWRDLDPIGLDEFQGIVANLISHYLRVAREQPCEDLDTIIMYYASQGWPCYTESERRFKPEWSNKLSEAQSAALQRHRDRIKAQDP